MSTEKSVFGLLEREEGLILLTARDIHQKIVGNQFAGTYRQGFKYIIAINEDGRLEGKNNYLHYDVGRWSVDVENNTLIVEWDNGWENTAFRLYFKDAVIRMYDSETGQWRSSISYLETPVQSIENYPF